MGCYLNYCFQELSRAETGVEMQNCICVNNMTIGIAILAMFFTFIMIGRGYWTFWEGMGFFVGGLVAAVFISNFL